jgi:hypothetical protein
MTSFITLDLVGRERRTVATPTLHSRHGECLCATTPYVSAWMVKIVYMNSSKSPSSKYQSGLNTGDKKPGFPLKIRRQTSDAHESSILAEALGLAGIFLPRDGLATLERASTGLEYTRPFTPLIFRCATVLDTTRRHSNPLASTRECATLSDDTRLDSSSTRPLVCITEANSQSSRCSSSDWAPFSRMSLPSRISAGLVHDGFVEV